MEKILVTGGAGFIGQNITKRLIAEGKEISIIDNLSTGSMKVIDNFKKESKNLKFYKNDTHLLSVEKYKDLDIDMIFHFAAPCSMRQFEKNPSDPVNQTVIGFMKVMEIAIATGATVIYPSSGTVYGNGKELQVEDDKPAPINLYGAGKVMIETLADYYRRVNGVKSMGLRIFAGYGPGEDNKVEIASAITIFLYQLLENKRPEIWGDGEQTRDFVYIDDVVNAAFECAKQQKAPVVNVGSGESITFNQVVKLLNENLGKNIEPIYVKKPKNYLQHTKADTRLGKKLYDFKPLTISEGIKRYVGSLK